MSYVLYLIPRYLRGEVNNTKGRVGRWGWIGLLTEQNPYTALSLKNTYIIVISLSLYVPFWWGVDLKRLTVSFSHKLSNTLFGASPLFLYFEASGGRDASWNGEGTAKVGLQYWPFRERWFESFRPIRFGVNAFFYFSLFCVSSCVHRVMIST